MKRVFSVPTWRVPLCFLINVTLTATLNYDIIINETITTATQAVQEVGLDERSFAIYYAIHFALFHNAHALLTHDVWCLKASLLQHQLDQSSGPCFFHFKIGMWSDMTTESAKWLFLSPLVTLYWSSPRRGNQVISFARLVSLCCNIWLRSLSNYTSSNCLLTLPRGCCCLLWSLGRERFRWQQLTNLKQNLI